MGGVPPLGYEVKDRKLIIKEADAANIRWIFARFVEIGSGTVLGRDLAARGVQTSRGNRIDKKYIYRLLNNRAYIGEAVLACQKRSRVKSKDEVCIFLLLSAASLCLR